MVGIIVQHLAEWQAHAVIVVLDIQTFWFPAVQQASLWSVAVAPRAAKGFFHRPSHRQCLKNWPYLKWTMRAYEVDLGSKC